MRYVAGCLLVVALAGCSLEPNYYATIKEQAIALQKGELESAGIAFITPSTVTGQEQEKQAVALAFADVLKQQRPGLKVTTLAETLSAVNRAGLAEPYKRMYDDYRDTGLFSSDTLRRVGQATGTRYIASAIAGTGPLLAAPLSAVGAFASTSESIALASFVPIPLLDYPAFGGPWDGRRLSVTFGPSATTVDLTVLKLQSGGGLVSWLVVAFISFISHLNNMLYGPAPDGVNVGELDGRGWLIPLLAPLSVLVIIGLIMPATLGTLLNRIMEIVFK